MRFEGCIAAEWAHSGSTCASGACIRRIEQLLAESNPANAWDSGELATALDWPSARPLPGLAGKRLKRGCRKTAEARVLSSTQSAVGINPEPRYRGATSASDRDETTGRGVIVPAIVPSAVTPPRP